MKKETEKRKAELASQRKPAYSGSCSKTDYCGLQIISWLIEPQTTKCLKNEAKHFSSSAVRCDWIGVKGLSPTSQEGAGTLDTPTQLARFLGKRAVSCLLAFSDSKSNFYAF